MSILLTSLALPVVVGGLWGIAKWSVKPTRLRTFSDQYGPLNGPSTKRASWFLRRYDEWLNYVPPGMSVPNENSMKPTRFDEAMAMGKRRTADGLMAEEAERARRLQLIADMIYRDRPWGQ